MFSNSTDGNFYNIGVDCNHLSGFYYRVEEKGNSFFFEKNVKKICRKCHGVMEFDLQEFFLHIQ